MGSSKIRSKERGGRERSVEPLQPDKEDIEQIAAGSGQLFSPVLAAATLAQQVEAIRQLVLNLKPEEYQIAAIVLVQWYFNCSAKSEISKVIAKCINSIGDEEPQGILLEQIASQLIKISDITEEDLDKSITAEIQDDSVKQILSLFENFPLGEKGVCSVSERVTDYVMTRLGRLVGGACEEDVSSAVAAGLLESAGDCSRVLVQLLRLAPGPQEQQDRLASLARRVMEQQHLPLELTGNCGQLYVSVRRGEGEAGEEALLVQLEHYSQGGEARPGLTSLLHGVMATASQEWLQAQQESRGLLALVLQCYTRLATQEQELTAVLALSRGLLGWSAKLVEYCTHHTGRFLLSHLPALFEYIWAHLEHPADAVKHNTKQVVRNLLASLGAGGAGEGAELLLGEAVMLPPHSKARMAALTCLVSHNAAPVLAACPTLAQDCLSLAGAETALAGQVTELCTALMRAQHRHQAGEHWYLSTVRPLLVLPDLAPPALHNMVTSLLKAAVKLDSKVIDSILADKAGTPTQLALACLKLGREQGRLWDWAGCKDLVVAATRHKEEEIRLLAFSVCVESHSSVELFCADELQLLLAFLPRHLGLQAPASQQVLTALAGKLLTRLKDGAAAASKKLTQRKFAADWASLETALDSYNTGLQELVRGLLDNLFPGANFPRRQAALQLLTMLSNTVGWEAGGRLNLSCVAGQAGVASLLDCLADPYEANKERALGLLEALSGLTALDCPSATAARLVECLHLARSCKPPDTLTAAAQARLLLAAPALPWAAADLLSLPPGPASDPALLLAVAARDSLAAQLDVAQHSLLEAAVSGPLYGTLALVHTVYQHAGGRAGQWPELTADLLTLCRSAWRAVASVVASDSPEGHLPMDSGPVLQRLVSGSLGNKTSLTPPLHPGLVTTSCYILSPVTISSVHPVEIAEELLEEVLATTLGLPASEVNGDECVEMQSGVLESSAVEAPVAADEEFTESSTTKSREVSSQMALLCAWRTVKEISLFLGHLCSTYTSSGNNLVSVQQILDISVFLVNLLSDTKHRGAFEQAYVAFTDLCGCLWRAEEAELQEEPARLLKEVLGGLASGDTRLCSTRRSAGLPFLVQAVLATEPHPSPLCRSTIPTLLATGGDQAGPPETRVHALNILRALFRDARLAERLAGWLEDGVRLAVTGFRASNWAERNAATLLFSALFTRMFGVKREKAGLSTKNCLTGKVFFQRYPSLHAFFLEQFEWAVAEGRRPGPGRDCALYPVLLTLGRILPSPGQAGHTAAFPPAAFLAGVEGCRASPVLQTRQLAAAALVPLVESQQAGQYCAHLVAGLEQAKLSQNAIHGSLLQLGQFLNRQPELGVQLGPVLASSSLVQRLVRDNPCCLTSSAYLALLAGLEWQRDGETAVQLQQLLLDRIFDEREGSNSNTNNIAPAPADVWKPLFFKQSANIVTQASFAVGDVGSVLKMLVHPEYEVRMEVFRKVKEHIASGATPEFPFQELTSLLRTEKQSECLERLLLCCAALPRHRLPADQLLCLVTMLEAADSDAVKAAGLRLCSRMANLAQPPAFFAFAALLRDSLDERNNFAVRKSAAEALSENFNSVMTVPETEIERQSSVLMWSCCVKLVMDDDPALRGIVSDIYESVSGEKISSSLAAESLVDLMHNRLGRIWPAADILVSLGAVLSLLLECEESAGMTVDVDKAFDKNEMNCYQELLGLALLLLPRLARYIRRLSPGLQAAALDTAIPGDLVASLLPELPGAVTVYTVRQLLEYLAARTITTTSSQAETVLMVMIATSLRCRATEEICAKMTKTLSKKFDKMKTKTFFLESVEAMLNI